MPKTNAATENLNVAYIITAGNHANMQTIIQFINKTAMREKRIYRGGIGIDKRSVLSFARKSILYATNALKAMLANNAIPPKIVKYIQSKPPVTRPSIMPAAQAQTPRNNTANKIPNRIIFVAMLLPALRFFFFFD